MARIPSSRSHALRWAKHRWKRGSAYSNAAFRSESWKHSVRELASLEQVANMPTWVYFMDYLEVGRSDLVQVSCRLSIRIYRKICHDGKDTSTTSVSKYRYVFTRKNYCCQTLSMHSDLRFPRFVQHVYYACLTYTLPRLAGYITRQRSEEQAIVLIVWLRAYHILTLCFPPTTLQIL